LFRPTTLITLLPRETEVALANPSSPDWQFDQIPSRASVSVGWLLLSKRNGGPAAGGVVQAKASSAQTRMHVFRVLTINP
jgi:hypothetical protein